MNAEIVAEWLRRTGHHVIRTPSSYWYDAGWRVLQAFPYHWIIEPPEEELRRLLLGNNAIALRYSAPIATPRGKVSYHVVCEDPTYGLACLRRQTRQTVRRGLESASIEQIPIPRLATEGWRLQLDTLKRQGRAGSETQKSWYHLCMSAKDLPGFESWGAMRDGQLVASFLAFKCDDCYTFRYQQSATSHLESRVNNAIFYSVTHEAFKRNGISRVFFNLQSLDAPPSVDQFKFRMGYTAKPVRQRVVFHPWLEPFANSLTYTVTVRLRRRNPGNPVLAKMEGMLRFNLQGKRAPDEQDWPQCLVDRKTELIEALNFRKESREHRK